MKVVIQRVDSSSVVVNNDEISSINNGLLILWGVEVNDSIEDVDILSEKILNLNRVTIPLALGQFQSKN